MATRPTYCTDRDLQDVYPHIDQFDAKRRIYNWQSTGTSNLYESKNTGVISQLFQDGELNRKQARDNLKRLFKEGRVSSITYNYYINNYEWE